VTVRSTLRVLHRQVGCSTRFEEILRTLQDGLNFCDSIGLGHAARHGRFGIYSRSIERLLKILPRLREHSLTDNERRQFKQESARYRIALYEGFEAAQIIQYLRQEKPPGFESRLRIVLGGPELPSEEDETSNQARNVQFELVTAGDLVAAGYSP